MKSYIKYLPIFLISVFLLLPACSKKAEEEKKGAIEEMTDRAAGAAVKRLRSPIEQAKKAGKAEEDRIRQMEETMEETMEE